MADTERVYDVVVIGGGIIGLATAMNILEQRPQSRLALIEAEDRLAAHQTGHSSGVVHSGIYDRPGTLRAHYCIEGAKALFDFCDKRSIPYRKCGKLIVATQPADLPRLEELQRRGLANGVEGIELIGSERLREIEPHARGLKALYSPETAVVDYRQVALGYADRIVELGGEIVLKAPVQSIEKRSEVAIVRTPVREFRTRLVVSCAGGYGDKIAAMTGCPLPYRILPFRTESFTLRPERADLVRNLIYPVPDPTFPFIGIHLNRTISGKVEVGPNVLLSLSKRGYRRGDFNLADCWQITTYAGFWAFIRRYWRPGMRELLRSYRKQLFLRDLRKLVPEVQEEDLIPGGAGVRAHVVTRDGRLCDDFAILRNEWSIHLLNAPSPAATAALRIGNHLAALSFGE